MPKLKSVVCFSKDGDQLMCATCEDLIPAAVAPELAGHMSGQLLEITENAMFVECRGCDHLTIRCAQCAQVDDVAICPCCIEEAMDSD